MKFYNIFDVKDSRYIIIAMILWNKIKYLKLSKNM